jgi:Uma2 family endonuclease
MGVAGARTTEPETESLSPNRRRFTVDEYHRMIDAGILGEDEHVELLEGEIVEMSPQEKPHARALSKLNGCFGRFLTSTYAVRVQLPLTLPDSEPEPDLAIVREEDEAAALRHPPTALLVVETASTSVRYDLKVKARLYAKAAIPEYWLVVVPKRTVEVLRDPDPKAGVYRSRTTLTASETLVPLAFPELAIPVESLFD